MLKKYVIKLSGESLIGENNLDFNKCLEIAKIIKKIYEKNIRLLIVIGGGNFWRGRTNQYMNSETSDYVGMLATEMNALVLGEALNQVECPNKVFLRYNIPCSYEYNDNLLRKSINDNILIVGGGTGKPGFSTDTGAALAAVDIKADFIIKMSKTDGVYDSDPFKNVSAKKCDKLSFDEVISKKLEIMDLTAFKICKDNDIKIIVTKMDDLMKIIDIEKCLDGTIISKEV